MANARGPVISVRAHRMVRPDFPPPAARKLRHSMFGITFNTNYRPKNVDEIRNLDEQFTEAIEDALTADGGAVLKDSLKVVESMSTDAATGKKRFVTHKITATEYEQHVKKIDTQYHNEVGANFVRGGRFHIHGYIYVLHTTMLQLDIDPIMQALNAQCRRRGIPEVKYAHVSYQRPGAREYMEKMDFVN